MKNDNSKSGKSGKSGKNEEHNPARHQALGEKNRLVKTSDKENEKTDLPSASGPEEETRDVRKTQPRSKINPPEETQEALVDGPAGEVDVESVDGPDGPKGVEGPNRSWKKAQDEQQEFAKQPGIDETDLKQHDDQGNPAV